MPLTTLAATLTFQAIILNKSLVAGGTIEDEGSLIQQH